MHFKNLFIVILLIFTSINVNSQTFKITGNVFSNTDKQPLEAATVYTENVSDSSMISYTITEKNGHFYTQGNTKTKEIELVVSFVGFQSLKKRVKLDKEQLNVGDLFLDELVEELDGVDVIAQRTPITIKKDTLEFNADSFKTRPDATVEDLLKQLPGVEVDSDGNITVNGKSVTEILVNGKPFFGDDPKIATKNLTKEIVSKIQVTDYKTREEKFTKRENDSENKSVNIVLKEGKNKGHFGRATAGYGTDERYELSGMLNFFNDDQKISLLASSNNINASGFSFDEVFDMMGSGGRGSFGRGFSADSFSANSFGSGITTSSSGGINFIDEFGDLIDANGSYFVSSSSNKNENKQQREYLLPDRYYFNNSNSSFKGETDSHRLNTVLEFKIDSMLSIIARPSFNYIKSKNNNQSHEESISGVGELINQSESYAYSENEQKTFSNALHIVKRFGSKGAYASIGFSNTNAESVANSKLNSTSEILASNKVENRNQISDTENVADSYQVDVSYRQPIANKLFVDSEYRFSATKQTNTKSVYDADTNGNYTELNVPLSSDFVTKNSSHQPTIGLRLERDKLRFSISAGGIFTHLSNDEYLQNTSFVKDFRDFKGSARVSYAFDKQTRMFFNYMTSVNTPSVSQLQPIANVNNPLQIVIGNPDLERAFVQSFSLNYGKFNFQKGINLFLWLNFSFTNDQVTGFSTIDDNLVRTTTYANVDGNYNGSFSANWDKRNRYDKMTFLYGLGASSGISRTNQFTNGLQFEANTVTLSPKLRLELNWHDTVETQTGYQINFSETKYDLTAFNTNSVLSHSVDFRVTSYWPKNVIFGNDFTYSYNPDIAGGFNKSALFWNSSLGLKLLDEKATLKIKGYDLLKQYNNSRRIVSSDYIQDSESTVLQQYFMLSFSYKFGEFGGEKSRGKRPSGGRKGPPPPSRE